MTDDTYEDEEKRYIKTVEEMYESWEEFLAVLKKEYPDYVWKESANDVNSAFR